MTARRIPLLPTLLVLMAVAVMVGLGFWQLDRLRQKEADLAAFTAAEANPAEVAFPLGNAPIRAALYHHSRLTCTSVISATTIAGRNAHGDSGLSHLVDCAVPGGRASVMIGWAQAPGAVAWSGGEVRGIVAPLGRGAVKLVADPPLAGLQPNARPDPREIPNNHLSYAVQWFLFAATALVIYALALRGRWRKGQ